MNMPIDTNDWNSGKKENTLKQDILIFLKKNPDRAFDIKEIIEGTGYSIQVSMQEYGEAPESRFRKILEMLSNEGNVEIRAIKKTIEEELYYKYIDVQTNSEKK
jgi:hypothetical protein